jgi:hypothetical protein
VAQLDRDRVRREQLDQRRELVETVVVRAEGRRELEQERRELARGSERLDRLEHGAGQLLLQPPVELHAPARPGRRLLAQLLRERIERRGVARQQPVQLDVEREAARRDLPPARDLGRGGNGVEGGVDLDGVEALRVVRQPVASRQSRRVPLLDEPGVRPARRADMDRSAHSRRVPG